MTIFSTFADEVFSAVGWTDEERHSCCIIVTLLCLSVSFCMTTLDTTLPTEQVFSPDVEERDQGDQRRCASESESMPC